MPELSTATDTETCEIEVTAEMIEAGRSELRAFNHDFEDDRDAVVRIYVAMVKAATSATH
jgi:hypothetical protein